MLPKVSIIIPAYNAQSTLGLCLDSVMNLEYPKEKLEVFLINNNSTDSTEKIANNYPVNVLREDKVQSSYAARNKGVEHAEGEILAFTDADCIVSPIWMTKLLRSASNPVIGCFAGNIKSYKPQTLAEQYADRDHENHDQFRCLTVSYLPYAQTANVAYGRKVFEKIGLFNSKFKSGGDVDFTWRMVKDGNFKIVYESDAIVYHKHRTTIADLFKQNKKYGESITELLKIYPGCCADTLGFFEDVFRFGLRGLTSFPYNFYLYHRGKISKVEMYFDLLRSLCRLGMVVGRIRAQGKREDGQISKVLVARHIYSRFFLWMKAKITEL